MKKLMLLGGTRGLLPVIKVAHDYGYYVITCDYNPDNIAHKYSDEYFNSDVIDKNKILDFAISNYIDGIMSFSVDAGVVTASYVAEKMHLPFQCTYEVANILQNKDRFRTFLKDNMFEVPNSKSYSSLKDVLNESENLEYPIIVKPVDSAGSTGVKRVDDAAHLDDAARIAFANSHCGKIIIEDYLESLYTSDSDCFVEKGYLEYCTFSDQFFDNKSPNPYVPSAYIWPSSIPDKYIKELRTELQRLISLLNIDSGIFNIETRICTNCKSYIMEVSPRGGGNQIAEMIKKSTGVDLINFEVQHAVGVNYNKLPEVNYRKGVVEVILHSRHDLVYNGDKLPEQIDNCIVQKHVWINKGDIVRKFKKAGDAFGYACLSTETNKPLRDILNRLEFLDLQ